MAYVPGQDEEEELSGQGGQEAFNLGGQSGLMGTGGPAGDKATGNGAVDGKPTKSGFTNLQKYLSVNSDKADGMATQVLGEGKKVEDDLSKEADNFGKLKVGAGVSDADTQQLLSAEMKTNLLDWENIDDDTKKFGFGAGKVYSGLQNSDVDTNAAKVIGASTAVKDKSKLYADNPDGVSQRANFLKSKYNQDGRYSAGEGSFDSFLTGASKAGTDEKTGFTAKNKGMLASAAAADKKLAADSAKYKADIAGAQGAIDKYNQRFSNLASLLAAKKTEYDNRPAPEEEAAPADGETVTNIGDASRDENLNPLNWQPKIQESVGDNVSMEQAEEEVSGWFK